MALGARGLTTLPQSETGTTPQEPPDGQVGGGEGFRHQATEMCFCLPPKNSEEPRKCFRQEGGAAAPV